MKSEKVWFKTADSAGDGTYGHCLRVHRIHTAGILGQRAAAGFFPSIIAIVMVITSIAAFFQTLKEEDQPKYNKDELMVIAGGAAVIAGSFIVGMIPMIFLFVLFWLTVIEKGTPILHIVIIEAIVAVIVLGVFAGWLQVQFPWGLFENFM